jgi:hypothetical protein
LFLICIGLSACGSSDRVPLQPDSSGSPTTPHTSREASFAEVFDVVGRITLEEVEGVVTVTPSMQPDKAGGHLLADGRAHQIRRYGPEGQLLWHFGREGQGPGEFLFPVSAAPAGERVIIAELEGRLSRVDPASGDVAVASLGFALSDLDPLNDSLVVVSTRTLRPGIIIWNTRSMGVARSFFNPYIYPEIEGLHSSLMWVLSDVHQGQIASTVALYDTLYVHTFDGVEANRIPIGVPDVRQPIPVPGRPMNEWHTGTRVGAPFWMGASRILIQFGRWVPEERRARHGLVIADLAQDSRVVVRDAPRLMTVEDGLVFRFQDPDVLEGNVLLVARLTAEYRQ